MSDHFSGPRAIAGPQCDICDFYAFSSPERTGHLVLVTNVVPNAAPGATFSEDIVYRFRLRTASIAGLAKDAKFAIDKREYVLDCTFGPPRTGAGGEQEQDGVCVTPQGQRLAFVTGDEGGSSGAGVRVFAGRRADPFFLDFGGLQQSVKTGRLAFKNPGIQTGAGANVMSVVVELDCSVTLPGAGPLIAAVGETVASGPLEIRLERMGRPEVKNMLLNFRANDTVNRTIELRDLYNLEDAFHVGPDYRDAYRARLRSNLVVFDGMDGTTEWPLDKNGEHPLTDFLMADYLVVDVTKPFDDHSFVEIENAMLAGREHRTSGGRTLNNDCMDALFTLYVNGGRGPRVSDGVDSGTGTASTVFPYLVVPNRQRDIPLAGAASIVTAQEAAAAKSNVNSYTVATADGGHVHKSFGRYDR
jgi:hypothetical protein